LIFGICIPGQAGDIKLKEGGASPAPTFPFISLKPNPYVAYNYFIGRLEYSEASFFAAFGMAVFSAEG
jgi:hypothetical protein